MELPLEVPSGSRSEGVDVDVILDPRWATTTRLAWRGPPDLHTVESLVALALRVRRSNGRIRLRAVPPDLDELLRLAGVDHLAWSDAAGSVSPVPRGLMVHLAVADVGRSRVFFSAMGFRFDDRFTDGRTACLELSGTATVMLLETELFEQCADRTPSDRATDTQAVLGVQCADRREVDGLVVAALSNGGAAAGTVDRGVLYARRFRDPDGHLWEAFSIDVITEPAPLEARATHVE